MVVVSILRAAKMTHSAALCQGSEICGTVPVVVFCVQALGLKLVGPVS